MEAGTILTDMDNQEFEQSQSFKHWRDIAACRDSEVDFFPFDGDVKGINAAKAICAVCLVIDDCIEYALKTQQPDGVWGGLTAKERRKIKRVRRVEIRRAL